MSVLRTARLVAGKDLRVEWRGRVGLNQVLPFAAVVMVMFAFALDRFPAPPGSDDTLLDYRQELCMDSGVSRRITRRRDAEGRITTVVVEQLQSMSDAGAVDVLRTDSGELIFRKCSDSHHHHLVCRVCGFTVEVEEPQVEVWAPEAGRAHGFTEVTH